MLALISFGLCLFVGLVDFFWCFRNISVGNDVGCRIAMYNPSASPFKIRFSMSPQLFASQCGKSGLESLPSLSHQGGDAKLATNTYWKLSEAEEDPTDVILQRLCSTMIEVRQGL